MPLVKDRVKPWGSVTDPIVHLPPDRIGTTPLADIHIDFPPQTNAAGRRFAHLLLSREIGGKAITVFLPNGNNYDMAPDNLITYLRRFGLTEEEADKLTAYVWNFYTVVYDTARGRWYGLSREELEAHVAESGKAEQA